MVEPEVVRGFLAELCKDAKVNVISPHKVRHTAATLAQVATGDLHAVQKMLGHFQISLTASIYGYGMRKIAGSVLDNRLIPLPQVKERKAIADALWAAHACAIALEAEAKLPDELFHATLEELMSGRLSVLPLIQEVVA